MMVMKDRNPDQAKLEVADNDDLLKPSYNEVILIQGETTDN
jgi:hypothetical protein